MHLFEVAFYLSGAYYAIFCRQYLLLPFLLIVGAYYLIGKFIRGATDISVRKKLMLATWSSPLAGGALVRVHRRVDRILQVIQRYPKEKQPTIAHFLLKAIGQMIKVVPDLAGSLSFGKFTPYDAINISFLTTINEGKDLVRILVQQVDKKSIEDIRDNINQQLEAIKSGKQSLLFEQDSWLRFLPATIIGFFSPIIFFIRNKLGVETRLLGNKNSFGTIIVAQIGNLNLQDVSLSLIDCSNTTGVVSICTPTNEPVVEGDQVVIGNAIQINFVMDHRWIDGGRCTKLFPTLNKMFQQPEIYTQFFKPESK